SFNADFHRAHAQRSEAPDPSPGPPRRQSPMAVPARLPQESGNGRIGHPVEPGPDREDAAPGRLGEHQGVRRIRARGGTFTRPILEQLGEDATLLTIDTNAD